MKQAAFALMQNVCYLFQKTVYHFIPARMSQHINYPQIITAIGLATAIGAIGISAFYAVHHRRHRKRMLTQAARVQNDVSPSVAGNRYQIITPKGKRIAVRMNGADRRENFFNQN